MLIDSIDFSNIYNKYCSCLKETSYSERRNFVLNENILKLIGRFSVEENTIPEALIPNLSFGELSLCVENWKGYSINKEVNEVLKSSSLGYPGVIVEENFLDAKINEKYKLIVLVPPFGVRTEYGRSEVAYMQKALQLLGKGGKLIAILPQNITTAPAFKDLRKLILTKFSLELVASLKKASNGFGMECSFLVIENKQQSDKIFMSIEEPVDGILHGFEIEANVVRDRIDANFYNPEYKEIRELITRRDTVKLGELAEVFVGAYIPPEERKEFGDYIVLSSKNINDGKLDLNGSSNIFCEKKAIEKEDRNKKTILKNGDILVSLLSNRGWAIYNGDDDFAIVNQNTAIIRPKQSNEKWIRLFFNTKKGVEYFESQLEFLSHSATFHCINKKYLAEIAVPDFSLLSIKEEELRSQTAEENVAELFKEFGWLVKKNTGNKNAMYDFELWFNNELRCVVEVKSYKKSELLNSSKVLEHFGLLEKDFGNIGIFLFLDDDLYEYVDGNFVEQSELPRPDNYSSKKNIKQYPSRYDNQVSIEEKGIDEKAIADIFRLEFARYGKIMLEEFSIVKNQLTDISTQIKDLANQISTYQSLVDRQLDLAVSKEEEERIIHAFSEECAAKIAEKIESRGVEKEYYTEQQKLIFTFGESAWNKMDESSRTFLVSSKVIFNNLLHLKDIADYSGVCLLVTKALEVELSNRFCKNFIAFLKKEYPGKANFSKFPTALLDKYKKPLKPKHFSLGTVAYVLCLLEAEGLTEEQKINNKEKLLEFARENLFKGKDDVFIMNTLLGFAESVETVREDYRNPSAHTNELKRVDAENCFEFVVDQEKLLKNMLDSFDE